MSLRVWLPLNGDLTNNGLSDAVVTNNGATVDNSGKIGKCYYFNGNSSYLKSTDYADLGESFSISAWVKLTGESRSDGLFCARSVAYGGFAVYFYNGIVTIDPSAASYSSSTRWTTNVKLNIGTWYHIAVTRTLTTVYLYVNGELKASKDVAFAKSYGNCFTIGTFNSNGTIVATYFYGYINDFRIYDHVLSPKEVKLLSQGLVCHYKLSDIYATDNLIPNGYGQDGAIGWNNSTNFSTSEIPSGHSEIKASFYGGNTTTTFIPISQGTTYTLSAYLKAKGSGTSYPSIFPYDADKHIIMNYNCADGFSNSYRTTLAQPLKKGDTVIYATDLSAWTTGDNYYFHVAIFGYKDSQGRVYPDMGYTYDSPVFGTKTDKSHINKTNNTITLNSAFTGEDRPAGTVICQATEGSTYYYPFGAVTTSSVSDWTLKTAVLSPSTTHRLKYAKYINYKAYSGLYHAGIKLVDNNFSEPYVLDSSGYNRHGVNYSSQVLPNAPRNANATFFDGSSQYIEFPNLSFMPTMLPDEWSFSFWVYNQDNGDRSIIFSNYQLGTAGINGFCFEKAANNNLRVGYVGGKFDRTIPNSTMTVDAWTHYVVTKTKAHLVTVYRNGIQIDSYTNTNCASEGVIYRMGRDVRSDSTMYHGGLADFRAYATVLTLEDAQELYNAPVSVANTGAMLTQGEFVEVTT